MPGVIAFFVLLLLVSASAQRACAEERSTERRGAAPSCRLTAFATGTVGAVVDGRTFVLTDGREIRLFGIEVPTARAQDPPERRRAGLAARSALSALIAGRELVLEHPAPTTDRYGRLVAVAHAAGSAQSVQGELVAQGHARVAAGSEAGSCAAELSTAERQARAAKLGLWNDPYYVVRQAESPAEVLAERGRFALVTGKVVSVRESGGTIYVNFGRRWSEDFTVTISKRNERLFKAAGMEPKNLRGRIVEVRGYVEERGGPWIEAVQPGQIMIVGSE